MKNVIVIIVASIAALTAQALDLPKASLDLPKASLDLPGKAGEATNIIGISASRLSDAEMLALLKARYERDMASGSRDSVAAWHGKLVTQIPKPEQGIEIYNFADGYIVTNKIRRRTYNPTNVIDKVAQAAKAEKARRKRLESQLAAEQKKLAAIDAGTFRAGIETRIESIKARLADRQTTNTVSVTIGTGEKQAAQPATNTTEE